MVNTVINDNLSYHYSNPVTLYNAGLTNDNQWMMSASNGVNTGVSRFSTLTNTMLGIYHLEKNSLDLSTSRLYTTFLCKASFLCMFFCTNDPFFFFRTTRDDMILWKGSIANYFPDYKKGYSKDDVWFNNMVYILGYTYIWCSLIYPYKKWLQLPYYSLY